MKIHNIVVLVALVALSLNGQAHDGTNMSYGPMHGMHQGMQHGPWWRAPERDGQGEEGDGDAQLAPAPPSHMPPAYPPGHMMVPGMMHGPGHMPGWGYGPWYRPW